MKRTKKTHPDLIFETKHWEVYLNPDQYCLGRSVVVAKRDVGSMSDLKEEEWIDFAKLVKRFESGFKEAFGATMFNWTCLMNNAYQSLPPNPHVHWHFRPRYAKSVKFEGIKFDDKEFGHHYAKGTDFEVPEKVFLKIIKRIKESL
ncbi:hypothetical protein A2685_01280 [Candidatus Woesebacteria bacterium RIFCSPHIGHO2_01_FULL_37_10]|uniref:HIT domain-containing protein n=1 Tax=Candidatus Woesebacteria bacterium RIFCSPHIGHO2_01_FULL_37_10 TaxID=1802489 RepID=A0A1F7XYV5_9BACT|nr:MAG: hypothetical protein A2685_01280 [Candidatus Woesebacteria bacterium RIFCSPHIGHO2_01_FULL_37_10]